MFFGKVSPILTSPKQKKKLFSSNLKRRLNRIFLQRKVNQESPTYLSEVELDREEEGLVPELKVQWASRRPHW